MTRMHSATDISRQNWEHSDQFSYFESAVSNSPIMDHFVNENLPIIRNSMPLNPNLQLLAADPGFAERAAKFSCFGSRSFNEESIVSPVTAVGRFPRVSSNQAMNTDQSPVRIEETKHSDETNMKLSRLSTSAANSNEESSVSNPKRKRGSTTKKAEEQIDESKRAKKTEQEDTKPPEPPKDYIHVRARRGQATDSHSLAERVRREKISERMKLLENLVPNCNKVTGKALMLDEIINYVQSLQRQVEFLSMKLATVDFATSDLMSQNIKPSNGSLCQDTPTFYQQELFNGPAPTMGLTQSVHEFTEHLRGFCKDDLQSIVRMGLTQHLDLDTSFFTYDYGSTIQYEN